MRCFIVFAALLLLSCGQRTTPAVPNEDQVDTVYTNKQDLISKERTSISAEPVATYREKLADELNDWYFSVQVFETKYRFHYLMKIGYEEMRVTDTLKLPNLGMEPKLVLAKGPQPYSCRISFYDHKNQLREYKEVVFKNGKLKINVLQRYAVYNP
ncbi:MAG: hypothetical protein MUF62_03415 [Chitinophagaceae bacterium]|jgi:hypothetical protein|nr:hypothetical protein [Chitinophagaceae bacterium]